jgi:hypothetical protein
MYEINLVVALSQTSVATKKIFDGVEILKPACTNKPNHTEQPKVPESTTKSVPPPSQPALVENTTTMTQLPLHPFANVKEMSYQPPHECNFATAAATRPAKEKEPAYHYVAPIQKSMHCC